MLCGSKLCRAPLQAQWGRESCQQEPTAALGLHTRRPSRSKTRGVHRSASTRRPSRSRRETLPPRLRKGTTLQPHFFSLLLPNIPPRKEEASERPQLENLSRPPLRELTGNAYGPHMGTTMGSVWDLCESPCDVHVIPCTGHHHCFGPPKGLKAAPAFLWKRAILRRDKHYFCRGFAGTLTFA